jgi:hypothetical protein
MMHYNIFFLASFCFLTAGTPVHNDNQHYPCPMQNMRTPDSVTCFFFLQELGVSSLARLLLLLVECKDYIVADSDEIKWRVITD